MSDEYRREPKGVSEQLRMMSVHAHPDDESSKGAATMARYVREGADVLVVTCTGGERGSILNPAMDRPDVAENIASIRAEETRLRRFRMAASACCRSQQPRRRSSRWCGSSGRT